jgi:CubicO group peptidase (beta-lactamase class C family)
MRHSDSSHIESIGTVRQVYDGSLTTALRVNTFRNIDRLFPVGRIKRGTAVHELALSDRPLTRVDFRSGGKSYDLIDYMALNCLTGLLILKDGRIAFEDYEMGNTEQSLWVSMSVAKSITATLAGAAIRDGYIEGIDDAVTRYLPQLAGSAYDGVSIRNLLQMASGVKWDETYTDPNSDRRRMLEAHISQRPGAILELVAKLPRAFEPGTVWNYNGGDTYVAGAVVRAAVGRPLAQYLSERIWAKFGMQADAVWWLDSPQGIEIGGAGIGATLRDYGRFGLFLLNDGVVDGERILPEGWVREAGSSKMIGGKLVNYGYLFWCFDGAQGPINDGAFKAQGIYGQHIYINAKENVVIVVLGALPKPTGTETIADADFFAAATAALHTGA